MQTPSRSTHDLNKQATLVSLSVCDLRLVDDQRWPWLLIIPRVPHAVELIDISPELRSGVWLEIDHVARVMRDQFSPHKLNIAALGNQVRQAAYPLYRRFRTMMRGQTLYGAWVSRSPMAQIY